MVAKVEIAARLKLSISPRKPLPVPSKARAKALPKKSVMRSVVRVFSCSILRAAADGRDGAKGLSKPEGAGRIASQVRKLRRRCRAELCPHLAKSNACSIPDIAERAQRRIKQSIRKAEACGNRRSTWKE